MIAPRCAACVSWACDQDSQCWSSVKRSSRTLLSTNVSKLSRSPAGQGEDLLGGHLPLAGATHATDLLGGAVGVDEQPRAMLVDAFICYQGIELDCRNGSTVVRFGPPQPANREFGEMKPDVILRANALLKNYVKNNYLD